MSSMANESPQTRRDDDFNARVRSAYFDLESSIHEHMATIAWTLFDETIKAPEGGDCLLPLRITREELECLEFAVSKTMRMASDLNGAYQKAITEAKQ
jgi:hypothetical protein